MPVVITGWRVVAVSETGARKPLSKTFSIHQAALDFQELCLKYPPADKPEGSSVQVESVSKVEK